MNFFSIFIISYIIIAIVLIYILYRDQQNDKLFFGKHKFLTWLCIAVMLFGIAVSVRTRFVEPYVLTINNKQLTINKLKRPIRIALVADIQAGRHKKTWWVEKIVKKINKINPDLVLIAGDLIDNEGEEIDETKYLDPLKKLAGKYPAYYVLGNHEYGIGGKVRGKPIFWTGDRSQELIDKMEKIGIPLLRDKLVCPEIKGQKICIYGVDDIWKREPTFKELNNFKNDAPLILLTHNPDAAMYWPKNDRGPDLVLAGHSHGGQIWMPFIGPLASAAIELGSKYYKGLNYYNNIPIFTTVGVGESGGAVRLFVPPEIAVIELINGRD